MTDIKRESIEDALENDRCGICGSVDHFREDCPTVAPVQTAHTPCAWSKGCDRSPAVGWPLFRTNPKGETGIFMCEEHAHQVRAERRMEETP